jgi:hypothetical protein
MMHPLHGIHLVVVPAGDWILWMMSARQFPQQGPALAKTKPPHFAELYVPESCLHNSLMLLCVVFIVFALLAVWWFSGDCC